MTTYVVVLNIKQEKAIETGISVSQGDYGQIEFVIRVKDDDDYILDAKSAIITFNTPNGEVVKGNLAGTQGTYHYTIQGNELLSPGKIVATVTLIYENGRKSSCSFNFYNRYNPLYDRGTPARSYVPEIEKIKKDGEEAVKYIENLIATGDFKGEPGNDGMDGADGKDAYTIAVDEGFVGTREEWLNSLKGETGKGIAILGSYGSYESLIESHPNGNTGDNYLINGNLYVWSDNENKWVDAGKIQGPPGESVASGVSAIDTQGVAVRKASGTGHVTITDAAEHPILNLNLAGKSEQVVTTGAQLFNAYNLSLNNATATITESGRVIKAVGKNTSASNLYANIDISKVAGKTVYLQGDQISKDNGTIQMQLRVKKADGTYRYATSTDAVESNIKLSLDINSDDTELVLFLYCRSASDLDNVSIFENVRVGIAESAWEPYTGGKPSPSPDYPQPIISTGTVSTGAQLFDASKMQSTQGVTWSVSDGGRIIKVSGGVATGRAMYELEKAIGRTLYISGTIASKSVSDAKTVIVLCVKKADDSWEYKYIRDIGIKGLIYAQIPNDAKQVRLDFNINDSNAPLTTVNTAVFKDVIISVDAPKPWEPYTGGKPSPSAEYPQTFGVIIKNKNITGPLEPGGVDSNGNEDNSNKSPLRSGFIMIDPKKKYVFSRKKTFAENSKNCMARVFDKNKHFLGSKNVLINTALSNVITDGFIFEGAKYIRLVQFRGEDENFDGLDLQMEEGNIATEYEPPALQTASITLTEPLRGIGDYRDRIMCRDDVWGIERQFVSLTFDGSEDENWGNITTNTAEKKRLMPNGIFGLKPTNTLVASPGLSNLFGAFIPAGNAGTFGTNNGISIDNAGNLIVYCEKYNTVNSLPAWKEFLQSNNLIVVAPLATPTWEPLPSATQSALNALATYKGVTHVTITAGGPEPDVGLGYFGQPGDKVTVQDMCDSFAAPGFDDSGVVQGISGFGDFLNRMTSGMRLPSFFRDLKAGLKFVLHTGQLVNNGLCNEPGKYPLDAAYGRTLLEMIGNTANLPGGAADIVSAIVTQNSNLTVKDISSAFSAISTYVASITAYQYGNVVFLTGTYTKNIPTGSISNIAVVINITDAKYYPIMYTSVDDITSGATADVPIKINAFVDPAGNIKAIATDALTSNKRFSVAYLIA